MPDDQNNPLTQEEQERAARLAGWTPEVSEQVPADHGLPSGDDVVEVLEASRKPGNKTSERAEAIGAAAGVLTPTVRDVLDEMQSAVGFVEHPGNRNPWGEEQFGGDAAYCCSLSSFT